MYFFGAYAVKDLKFMYVVLIAVLGSLVAYVTESPISSGAVNWIVTIPECGAFVLGYIVYHVLR
jgi:hypothetical protein